MAVVASAAVSALMQVVFERLASGILQEFGLAREDLEVLESTLLTIQDVLEDAETRSINEKSLRNWLRRLKDVAYDADDLLDEFQTEALCRKAGFRQHVTGKVRNFFSSSNPVAFNSRMARKIKNVMRRLDAIAAERSKFHLGGVGLGRSTEIAERRTSSFVNELEVYGRNEDRENVMEFLVNAENDKILSVLPIVGLGGLGKTTLAQLVYNDERTKGHFDLLVWVCVSQNFDERRITKTILECASWNEGNLLEREAIHNEIVEKLKERRFLLILDDVWNESEEKWEQLKYLLSSGLVGSKVIVTTRSEKVASIMGTVMPYRLGLLSEDHCWILFKKRAFGMGRGKETARLVTIGKAIVKKCGGVPLAAKALGSLMAFKRGEGEWLAIRDSEIWKLPEDEVGILPALKLSYDCLPFYLKQCFAYCALFPKNYKIDKEKLIELWIAEGFVLQFDESMQVEDIGNEYFNNLLWRSFFQDVQESDFANKVIFTMHDLIHDLARYVAGKECSVMQSVKGRNTSHGCRYLSVICDRSTSEIPKASYKERKLRSYLLLLKDSNTYGHLKCAIKEVPESMFSILSCLRVLDLSSSSIKGLPGTIGRLKHLRLLDLSGTEVETLPNSITSLHNLQRLNLQYCFQLCELPKDMRNMLNLKHLNIHECLALTRIPHGIGQLNKLMTLSKFIVGKEHGRTIVELRHLELLKGQLRIDNLENVKNPSEAKEASLNMKSLLSLSLWWKIGLDAGLEENMDEDILENLQPHSNLEQLVIVGYRGIKLPKWMNAIVPSSSFPSLISITLNRLKRCKCLPPFGLLPSLKVLNIYEMDSITDVGREFYGDGGTFPSLERLTFWDMPKMKEWLLEVTLSGRELFPCLTSLTIKGCPALTTLPDALQCLTTLQVLIITCSPHLAGRCRMGTGEDWYKIVHIPHIEITM